MKVLILVDYDLDDGEDGSAAAQALADAVGEQVGVNDATAIPEPQVLAVGNAFEGITLYGPFEDVDSAEDFVSESDIKDDWLVTTIKVG